MLDPRPGERMDRAPHWPQIDFSSYQMRVSTERYHSREFHERERQLLWMRVWQIAGRADDIPDAGDWFEYRLFDQSFLLVRGRDGAIRGFANACRHRGNALCSGKGHATRFTCPYHNWSFGLDGRLLAVAKPDFEGTVEEFAGPKEELGLVEVPVECFAGFIFLNPDRDAAPLADFLGEAYDLLDAYRLEELIPSGMNVRETIKCNWKVVMDAFLESYHVQGVHPELVGSVDLTQERFGAFGNHAATTVPFGGKNDAKASPQVQVEKIWELPVANFPGLADVLPRFENLVAAYRGEDGALEFPPGVTARSLLQQATRETWMEKGLDVSDLTDSQMSDYQFWLLFPNVYMQIGAGEATVIIVRPDPDGDPNRCYWQITSLLWAPPEQRQEKREPLFEVPEGEHFKYFLALEQDYSQMENQQLGLRNEAMEYITLTKQEPKLALFHTNLDHWLEDEAAVTA